MSKDDTKNDTTPPTSDYVATRLGLLHGPGKLPEGTSTKLLKIRNEFHRFAVEGAASFIKSGVKEETVHDWLARVQAARDLTSTCFYWNHVEKTQLTKEDFDRKDDPEADTKRFIAAIEDILKDDTFAPEVAEEVRAAIKLL